MDNKKSSASIDDCKIIELGKHSFPSGNLTVVQPFDSLPFKINRVFYLYDIPGGESRGAHAHKKCHQFLVAASGAFEVAIDDGKEQKVIRLERSYYGLHIPPGIWAAEQNFSSGSVCLVIASENYDEDDYIRDYSEFINWKCR